MVSGIKKTYRTRGTYWRRRKYMFYKSVKNFHYAKLSFATTVEYTNTIKFAVNNSNQIKISDAITQCDDWLAYAKLFLTFRLRGIAIQVTPIGRSTPDFSGNAAAIGLITPTDTASFKALVESDQSLILPYQNFASKYIKLSYPWYPSQATDVFSGIIRLDADAAVNDGAFRWAIKFIFYVLYKTNC